MDPNTLKLIIAGAVAYGAWLLYSKSNNAATTVEESDYSAGMAAAKEKAEAHAALMLSKPTVISAGIQPWYHSKLNDPKVVAARPDAPKYVEDYDRASRGWTVIHKLAGDPTRYATSFPA